MAELPAGLLVHRVAVQPLMGTNAYGDVFGDAVEFPAWVQRRQRFVFDPTTGGRVLSDARVLCQLYMLPYTAVGCLLTLHTEAGLPTPMGGRIVSQTLSTDGGLGAWQHLTDLSAWQHLVLEVGSVVGL